MKSISKGAWILRSKTFHLSLMLYDKQLEVSYTSIILLVKNSNALKIDVL